MTIFEREYRLVKKFRQFISSIYDREFFLSILLNVLDRRNQLFFVYFD